MIFNIKKTNLFVLFISFLMIFYISYLTPWQSDDYGYFLKGLDINVHINHYLSWSGRFISDYISSLILILTNNFVKSILIAASLICMLYIISKIPSTLYETKNNIYSFIFIFTLYWIENPNLGQTVFWIVGAANYLFTNLFICIYLYFLCLYISGNKKSFIPLLVFSFLAGLSNENTSIIVVCISLTSSIYNLIKNNDKKLFTSTFIVIIGASFLILSPGNFSRAKSPTFEWWMQMSILGKIKYFISYTFPVSILKIYSLLIINILLLIISFYVNNKKREQFIVSLLFLMAGLLSIASMFLSPTFPSRALIGPSIFIIISCSFCYNSIINDFSNKSIIFVNIITILYTILFLYSYVLICYSSNRISLQEKIRKESIYNNLNLDNKYFTVPGFFWPKSFRKGDSLDTFPSPLSKFYKVDNIDIFDPYFDYSIILDGKKIKVGKYLNDNIKINEIYIGKNGLLGGSSIALLIENNNNLKNIELKIFIINKNQEKIKVDTNKNNLFNINTIIGKSVIGFTSRIRENNIKSIIINGKEIIIT